jgi:hypothetical protein
MNPGIDISLEKTTLAQPDKYFDPYSRLDLLNFSVELKRAVITELQKYFVHGTYLAIESFTEDSTKIEFVICHSCSAGQQYYQKNGFKTPSLRQAQGRPF